MNKTTKADQFREIFRNSLKINTRSMSVGTLLGERNLKRIDYSPYYQRNYVWDNEKQTFFIESVILGTEIPPLILFKMGSIIEVIDGRQRFETLKKFKENDITLTHKGLKELNILKGFSFNKLSDTNKDTFLTSNIRIFEFEVVNNPDLSEEIIDRVKKEIFRRYNTGITPLTKDEVDNAKYNEDNFSEQFKKEFKNDPSFFNSFNNCFVGEGENLNNEINGDSLISKNVDLIRKFRILKQFPITTYARGSSRTEITDLLYDFLNNNVTDPDLEFLSFKNLIYKVISIHEKISKNKVLQNKYIYECILWALSILESEGITINVDLDILSEHYKKNIAIYIRDNSHYYSSIISRFEDTANLFKRLSGFDFELFIRNNKFKEEVDALRQTEEASEASIQELSNLRLHKPNPTSIPVDELRNDLKTSKYLLRPSYQRQEKITELKASSIMESILLGINLPPIFIFKRKNKIKEVVDGQQRLLSIIAYLGDQFSNEDGSLVFSKNNNYKLKGLRILTDLEGKRFSDLEEIYQDKILDFVLDLIIIEEEMNDKFDPIDLFIRLNYKPYPIKQNSFEMWNSIVDIDVIKAIKEVRKKNDFKTWFFLREIAENKPDRMLNEELITTLSYINYKKDVIGFFQRQDTITCRLKDKKELGEFLIELDSTAIEKNLFLTAIKKTETLILKISQLFDNKITKETFNDFLNVKKSKTFRRTLQDFYIIWLVLSEIPETAFIHYSSKILKDISELLILIKNTDDLSIDDTYVKRFEEKLIFVKNSYNTQI